jgi:hypothetical protein
MALADYFSKDLLAISQVLKKGTNTQLQDALNKTVVGIAFDDDVETLEGKATLDMTVRLLSRLYPKLIFIDLSAKRPKLINELTKLSQAINSKIEIVEGNPDVVVAIGRTPVTSSVTSGPIFYIGSDEWNVKFSSWKPVGSGSSLVPFGAGISGCIGASNVFRYVFKDFLPDVEFDEEFSLSLITLQTVSVEESPSIKSVVLDDFTLIGFGAVGNGAVWALANSPFIEGKLTLVEPETLALTNLQRYILAEESYIEKPKIDIARDYVKTPSLKLNLFSGDWVGYLNSEKIWLNKFVLVAVDNAKDRIGIQSSLPKELINSYTENNLIGISRHFDFGNEACLICTYMPNEERKSHSQEVAENLGLPQPQMERFIRDYLYYNKPADEQLLKMVAAANSIDYSDLKEFEGIPVPEFYSKVVCGGALMELRKGESTISVEAPLAFQSAMAGILLISELVVRKGKLRKEELPVKTDFYPLLPIRNEINPYIYSFSL